MLPSSPEAVGREDMSSQQEEPVPARHQSISNARDTVRRIPQLDQGLHDGGGGGVRGLPPCFASPWWMNCAGQGSLAHSGRPGPGTGKQEIQSRSSGSSMILPCQRWLGDVRATEHVSDAIVERGRPAACE